MKVEYISQDTFDQYRKLYNVSLEELSFVLSYLYDKDCDVRIGKETSILNDKESIESYKLFKDCAESLHRSAFLIIEYNDGTLHDIYHRKYYKELI